MDLWMVTEGYRPDDGAPGLDLLRRELCTVAQMAVPRSAPSSSTPTCAERSTPAAASSRWMASCPVVNPLLSLRSVEKGEESCGMV
jgi:hypothetical protein